MPVRLIHITAELPPVIGGVADYSAILTQRLVEVSGETLDPVYIHAGKQAADAIDVEYPVADLSGQSSATALADEVEQLADEAGRRTVVLLEYSGYGYAKRGAPLWLARAVRRVCGEKGIPLVAIFHEIKGAGSVWSSSFWLSPFQLYVARYIARFSEGVVAPHSTGLKQLGKTQKNARSLVCPVFSNVEEPKTRPPWSDRSPRAVVFGGESTKKALYDTHRSDTRNCLKRWEIETVVDYGPPTGEPSQALGLPVEVRGVQPAEEISTSLLNARIGLLHYPAAYVTKSGVMAAYMAHGVVPVLVQPDPFGGKLKAGTHFAVRDTSIKRGAEIAQTAAMWYDENVHSHRTAETILQLMSHSVDDHSLSTYSSRR